MTISIARKTIIHEWRRFLAAGVALTLSGLLMLVQIGVLLGMFDGVTVLLRRSPAELVAVSPEAMGLEVSSGVPARYEPRFLMNPDVVAVAALRQGQGDLRHGATRTLVTLVTVDPRLGDPSIPRGFDATVLAALRKPGTVAASREDLRRLGVSAGGEASINRKRVTIAPPLNGFRSQIMTYVFGSPETMRLLGADAVGNANYAVKLRPGANPARVQRELMDFPDSATAYDIQRPDELADTAEMYWLQTSGVGMTFGFTAAFAALIGIGITTQTLRAAVLGSIREYAALRALGFGRAALRGIVIGKAWWIGIAAFAATLVLAALCWAGAAVAGIVLTFPWWLLAGVGAFQIMVALLSGLLTVGVLYKSEPAELLR